VTATALFAPRFTLVGITIPTITPLSITAGRMVLATGVLAGWAQALDHHLPPWRDETGRLSAHWRFFAVLGLVRHVLPFTLITWGQQEVAAGLPAILVGLMPLMTLALAVLFVPSERLDRRHLAGIGLGFLGIVVLTAHQSLIHEKGSVCLTCSDVTTAALPLWRYSL